MAVSTRANRLKNTTGGSFTKQTQGGSILGNTTMPLTHFGIHI